MPTDDTPAPDRLAAAARSAFELGTELDWRSYDPYDLLLSPYVRGLQSVSWLGARVAVQIGKRSGTGLRRTLRVPRHEEAKTLSDFLRAASRLAAGGQGWALSHAEELAARLIARSTAVGAEGRGWGLDFPYASRFVNVTRGTPNLYTTTGACEALLDFHHLSGDTPSLRAAVAGSRFILDELGWFDHAGQRWLRYWQGLETPAINVQSSAASLLRRLGEAQGDDRLLRAAEAATATVLATQHPDGSWPYAEDPRAQFVDGFHTGFTLQGLAEVADRGGTAVADEARAAVHRGYGYFRQHLLGADGLPLEFADGRSSLDGQTLAQGVQTLIVCGRDGEAVGAAGRIWVRGLEAILESRPGGVDRFPALRWSVGPAVLATAYLIEAGRRLQPAEPA